MSFFGFDTRLPRDRRDEGVHDRGRASSSIPTASSALDVFDDEDAAIDAKIASLAAGSKEDVEIYTWGQGGYDALGDILEEVGDDANDETFGDSGPIGKDFDFGATLSATPRPSKPEPKKKSANDAAFATTSLEDFWGAPTKPLSSKKSVDRGFGGLRSAREEAIWDAALSGPARSTPPLSLTASTPSTVPPASAPALGSGPQAPSQAMRTLEDIEAELRQRAQQQTQQQQPRSAAAVVDMHPPQRTEPPLQARPLTVEEVEAQMLAQRSIQQQPPPPSDPQMQGQLGGLLAQAAALGNFPPGQSGIPPPFLQGTFAGEPGRWPPLPAFGVSGHGGGVPHDPEAVVLLEKAQARIIEHEKMEEKRRRKGAKIAAMAKYNGLMSQSDKDFITRIQVSHLVTKDPYVDDFYAHIYNFVRGRQPPSAMPNSTPGLPTSAGPGTENAQAQGGKRRLTRRENAMIRMQQQVERIVNNSKQRGEKASTVNLEGALGKISLSTSRGPRQLLQVGKPTTPPPSSGNSAPGTNATSGASAQASAAAAALNSAGMTGASADGRRKPLTRREVLTVLEDAYDTVMQIEQGRRNAPPQPAAEGQAQEQAEVEDQARELAEQHAALVLRMWSSLRVLAPLEISYPHPFISLLSVSKGKKLIPRVLRHLSAEQTLTLLTMIVASFESLDVVQDAAVLDDVEGGPNKEVEGLYGRRTKKEVESQTDVFLNTIVPAMLQLVSGANMRIVSGMLALFVERNDIVKVARTKPGLAFLTIFLSRAEILKQGGGGGGPDAAELEQWRQIFSLLFARLHPHFSSLFPSTRLRASLPFGTSLYLANPLVGAGGTAGGDMNQDREDEPVWQFFAALAVSASMEQQQTLVQELREKILEAVVSGNKKLGGEEAASLRIRNVNLLLHALNLDSSQIVV